MIIFFSGSTIQARIGFLFQFKDFSTTVFYLFESVESGGEKKARDSDWNTVFMFGGLNF